MMKPDEVYSLLVLVGGLLAVVGLFVAPIIYWGTKHERHKRELEHAERMKAIECGYPLDSEMHRHPALAVGVGVPAIAFSLAMVATFLDAGVFAWPAAGATGLAAVICGTILAYRSPVMPPQGVRESPGFPNGKVAADPDVYDVTGRRG